ncbi:RagB/SusD family nutrient uptake outer membrane protein [Spirosoma taeanense]|uniref:RagB/SusD family nutrient uptake outer membrane protein n=1 Tax=Spirosoma taeanense TaxID=2735870 RepID=A0A6M5YBM4_9BACT|nr:RagB/SusD family nutrient uptake outer membrane protein [Spirosoma taeanense]QJW91547.1 RagB/SusD family nutrient uptake outer membrane protein [Spirosoma taeanense]
MKTRQYYILASAVSVGLWLTSCDSKLDIKPVNTVATAQALSTPADLQALLVGAYNSLGDADLYGGNIQRDAELLGDNGDVEWTGTFTAPREVYTKRLLVTNGQADITWTDAYRTINICNTVLANLNLALAADKDRTEGEAKFIRASMYFELVRMFARPWGDGDANANPGVPLVTTPTAVLDASSSVPRSSVAAVYDQVIKDLTDAETKLPATNGFFAAKGAAAAQLSRVYLQKSDFPNAANAANRVIASGRYQLVPIDEVFDLRENINGVNTSETIFAVQVTDQSGTNSLNTFYGATDVGGRGDINITERHLSLYGADDVRGQLFYEDSDGLVRTAKYLNQYGNIQILRLAEMYLTRAEANFRAGTTVGATPLTDINRVRARAGAAPLTESQLTLNAILRERRLELAFEGTLIHDLKRTRQSIGSLAYNSPRLIFPIPLRETTTNPALVQNAGY